MRLAILLFVLAPALLTLGGCGDESGDEGAGTQQEPSAHAGGDREAAGASGDKKDKAAEGSGTTVAVGDSEFGQMLFGSDDQAIYIFENDGQGESNCYGECAEAWPPVLTRGTPQADEGVTSRCSERSNVATGRSRSHTPASRSTSTRTRSPARCAATT